MISAAFFSRPRFDRIPQPLDERRNLEVVTLSRYCLFAAQVVLSAMIVAIPWIHSGRLMPGRLVAGVAVALALILLATRTIVAGFAWKSIRLPLGLVATAALLGAWQLTTVAADLSPAAAALKGEFAATPDSPAPASVLSYYTPGTRRQIANLVCALAAMALGAVLFSETKAMLLLMSVIAASGFTVACSGLVERATGMPGPYFFLPLPSNAAPFGPFLNRNAAGSLMELGLAAATGLTVWRIARMPRRSGRVGPADRLQWFLMHIDLPLLVSFGALVTIAAGVFASLSRGTMLATIVGSVAALLIAGRRTDRHSFFWLTATVATAAAAMGIWLVQSSALESRWSSILAGDIMHESRWGLWRESLDAARYLQPFGSGLGAFYYGHAPFEHFRTHGLSRNADNQYVETLVVGGACGIVLLAALCGLIVRAVVRMWRKAQSPEHVGLAAGATAMVVMQLVHSFFDFAWYLPAVMFPLALWCGAIFRKASIKRSSHRSTEESGWLPAVDAVPEESRRGAMIWGAAIVAILLPSLAWAGYETVRSAIVERTEFATRNHLLAERNTDELDGLIKLEAAAIEAYPDDGEAHLRLAELYVERYASELRSEVDRDPVLRLQRERFLPWQDPALLNAEANLRQRVDDDEAGLKQLRELNVVKENLVPALASARRARTLCPTSPFAQTLVAELCFLDEPASSDAFYLERAERLSQARPDWLFTIGQIHLNGARPEQAWQAWRRAWPHATEPDEFAMFERASAYLKPNEILEKLLPQDPRRIVKLADKYFSDPDSSAARRIYYRKAAQFLGAEKSYGADTDYVYGVVACYDGDLDTAERQFMSAVRAAEAKPEWLPELAVVQAALGKRNEAEQSIARYRERAGGVDPKKKLLHRAADILRDSPKSDSKTRRRCAELYLDADAVAEAIAVARDAAVLEPSDIEVRVLLGKALLQTGDVAGAQEVAVKLEAIAPEREDVRNLSSAIKAAPKKSDAAP